MNKIQIIGWVCVIPFVVLGIGALFYGIITALQYLFVEDPLMFVVIATFISFVVGVLTLVGSEVRT